MKEFSRQYLQNYSLSKNHSLQISAIFGETIRPIYSHVLIIPAYNESTAFVRKLLAHSFAKAQKILTIIVVNQPYGRHATTTRLNQRLIQFLLDLADNKPFADTTFICKSASSQTDVLCINSCEPGIAPKQGVGFARKLGCDVAIALMRENIIKTNWLHCTDADTTLPSNYFAVPAIEASQYSALNYKFDHSFNTNTQSTYQIRTEYASKLYEKSLRYYCAGLQQAGSAYAFITIGSAIAINPQHYCQVRGFPLRAAGEDFYLLNKLAKLAPVLALRQTVTIKPRASLRVPFGTGPAVAKLLGNAEFKDFDPQVFCKLQEWLAFLPELYCMCMSEEQLSAKLFDGYLSIETQKALANVGIDTLMLHIKKQAKNSSQAQRMAHDWFDGFKTLKFIHALTNTHYPKLSLKQLQEDALSNMHFKNFYVN